MPATTDKEFLIRVRADIRRAVNELKQVEQQMRRTGDSGQRAGRQFEGAGRSFGIIVYKYFQPVTDLG